MKEPEQGTKVYQVVLTEPKTGDALEVRFLTADSFEEAKEKGGYSPHLNETVSLVDSERLRNLVGKERFKGLFEELCSNQGRGPTPICYVLWTAKEKAEWEAGAEEMEKAAVESKNAENKSKS